MGQREIFDYLKAEYSKNPEKWHSVKEIRAYLIANKMSDKGIVNDLFKLTVFNQLNMRGIGIGKHYKVFQIKLESK